MRILKRLFQNDGGASAAEYALILAIIGGAVGVAALTLGGAISNSMNVATGEVNNCGGGC